MYRNLLPYLRCAECGDDQLLLLVAREERDDVIEGGAKCDGCGHVMRVVDGILDAHGTAPIAHTPAQLTNYLAAAAWGYERLWRWQALGLLSGRRFPLESELRLVRGLLDLQQQRDSLLLDVACSTGLYARALARAAPEAVVAGIDHSWAMLREARRRALHRGLPISFVRAIAQTLPFRSASVAGCAMGGSLNEIGDIDAMLVETHRVLAANGRFVSMNLLRARSGWGKLLQKLLGSGGIEFPDQDTLNRRFEAANLSLRAQWRWRVVEISLLQPRSASCL